jgi:hypothetical protein
MPTTTRSAVSLPFTEAVDFFRQKVNIPTESWLDVMNEAHSHGFAVAGAANEAMLGDFRTAVDKAIAEGTGFKEFQGDFNAIVKRYGWQHTGTPGWRAKIIYETNLNTAFAAGRYAQLTQPDTLAAFPYWQYNHTSCANPRLQHLAWDGLILPADDAFWSTCYPPNGWGCRCFVTAVSAGGLRRLGRTGPNASPVLQTKVWTNKRTGELLHVPVGVDPGFAYNPGKAWKEGARLPVRAPDVRPVGGKPPALARPGSSAVEPHVLHKFIEAPEGAAQVATLRPQLVQLLGAKTPRVLISSPTMIKQLAKHPELAREIYQEIDELLRGHEIVLQDGDGRLRIMGRAAGRAATVVIKRTGDGEEVFVLSFHFLNGKTARGFLKRDRRLLGNAAAYLAWVDGAR